MPSSHSPDRTSSELRIEPVDLARVDHRQALLALLDEYAQTPEGGGQPLDESVKHRLCDVLASRAHYSGWIAFSGTVPAGLANCFEGVSTFRAQALLNIHDIVVAAPFRRQGIAKRLLAEVEQHARNIGCCKLTLEVLEGNRAAIAAYLNAGFKPYALDPAMGQAVFLEKKFV
jgi:GNAT superfamily N-acetyltransferase